MAKAHSFHIPVMGIGYTIDTPLKIAQYGMDSAISLVDDILLEKLRKMYCEKFNLPYEEISSKSKDFRARRITAYLNLINTLTKKNFEDLKNSLEKGNELKEFFSMLADDSELKREFNKLSSEKNVHELSQWLNENLSMGSIDVNIMTKIDRSNYKDGEKLGPEYNDAHSALRGYANSDLISSLVLSAGINPRLYTYIQNFEDFYPDKDGDIKKKIVLKVSDYKSALIQGKFLAKKGLWVSEYRIESGLNCGGHAFATDGQLLGPVLARFRDNRQELIDSIHEVLLPALEAKGRAIPSVQLPLIITAQGGVGTAEEHNFLTQHYEVDSIGWGSPFLLVPEATTVDDNTLQQLIEAREEDLYLSDISPLGVPFNSLRGNTKDLEKLSLIAKGKPGSSCSKKYAALSSEFSDKTICTASRRYQTLKLKELAKAGMSENEYQEKYEQIVDKSCICVGLGTSSLLVNNLDTKIEGDGVSVCPGPNMAYYSRAMSLREITDHIYGRANMIDRKDRPHMFIKELEIYLEFLNKKIKETKFGAEQKQIDYLLSFAKDIENGIQYYYELFDVQADIFMSSRSKILRDMARCQHDLALLHENIEARVGTPEFVY